MTTSVQFAELITLIYSFLGYYPGHPMYLQAYESTNNSGYLYLYSKFGQLNTSTVQLVEDTQVSYASNGRVRVRLLSDKTYEEFNIEHIVDEVGKNTILQFYNDNKKGSFEFLSEVDGNIYSSCKFIESPRVEIITSGIYKVSSKVARL